VRNSTDIWFCAWLLLRGYVICKHESTSKNKVKCYFNVDDSTWNEEKIAFLQSDIGKYKMAIEQIKDLGY